MKNTSYDLIIFDCDGTLVDSETLCNQAVTDLLGMAGFPQYDLAYTLKNFVGWDVNEVAAFIEQKHGRRLPDFAQRYEQLVNDRLAAELRMIEGVRETVPLLGRQAKLCIASNGERSNVIGSVAAAGLSLYFNDSAIFTKNMVAKGKPAPDLILLAARTMGVSPERVLLVEDSVAGTKAGKAAGVTVIGLTATYHDKAAQEAALKAAGAAIVTDRFDQIPRLAGFKLS